MNAVAEAFRHEVTTGLPTNIDKTAEEVVDGVVGGEARLWPEVVARLKLRRAVHGEHMGPEVKVHPVNRARPLEALQRECHRALDSYDAEAEGRRLCGAARWAALATLLLPLAGLAAATATLARTETARGVVTAIVFAAGPVAAGLLPVPAVLGREKARLEQGVEALRQRLTTVLRTGFERELQAGQKRVKDAVAPFGGLVRAEGERVRALSAELEGRRRDFSALRTRIEALR
jgi:hypothetical protein